MTGDRARITRYGRIAVLLVVAGLVLFAREMHAAGLFDPRRIQSFINDRPLITAGAFVLLYGVCVISFIPTLPLNLAAGLLWGWLAGGMLATLGVTLGAVAAFVTARFLLGRAIVERLQGFVPGHLRRAVDRLGWRAVAFFRLNPAFPTSVINYVLGVTSLPLGTYCWSTFVFLLPVTLTIAVIGEQTNAFIVGSSTMELMNAVIVMLAAAAILVAISWAMRLPKDVVQKEQ